MGGFGLEVSAELSTVQKIASCACQLGHRALPGFSMYHNLQSAL